MSYNEKQYDEAINKLESKINEVIRFYLTLPLLLPSFDYSDIHFIVTKLELLKKEALTLILKNFQNQ
jgi:hypothetical protein